MRALVTGSAGHLGEALVRTLRARGAQAIGLDLKPSAFTSVVGSICDPDCVRRAMAGVSVVMHAATLHKPHIATHVKQDFIDTNVTGTLVLLEEAARAGVSAFIFSSTTSAFGDALRAPPGTPAAWITEDVMPVPKNIYSVTKRAAEDLCALFSRRDRLPALVLRLARFFPEPDDDPLQRAAFDDLNLKANEMLYRRADIADMVSAHLCAAERAREIGFGTYIISATTPFQREDAGLLGTDGMAAAERRVPGVRETYAGLGWRMLPRFDRVYDNVRARADLGWAPAHDFRSFIAAAVAGENPRSPLTHQVGIKGYHGDRYTDGVYPVG